MNRTAATYNKAGKQFYHMKKYQEAVDSFMSGVAYDPKNASLRYNLAAALFKNGDYDGAFREAELALFLDPGYDKARELLEALQAVKFTNDDGVI